MKEGELFFSKSGNLMRHMNIDYDSGKVKFSGAFPAIGLLNWVAMRPFTKEERKEITDRLIVENGLIREPSKETLESFAEYEEGKASKSDSVEELFKELQKE
jgi:hypothetical protein